MSDFRKCIVFRQNCHFRAVTVVEEGMECRLISGEGVCNLEPGFLQDLHHLSAGFKFLIRKFRMLSQVTAQFSSFLKMCSNNFFY